MGHRNATARSFAPERSVDRETLAETTWIDTDQAGDSPAQLFSGQDNGPVLNGLKPLMQPGGKGL